MEMIRATHDWSRRVKAQVTCRVGVQLTVQALFLNSTLFKGLLVQRALLGTCPCALTHTSHITPHSTARESAHAHVLGDRQIPRTAINESITHTTCGISYGREGSQKVPWQSPNSTDDY